MADEPPSTVAGGLASGRSSDVDAFWSVYVHNAEFFFVENPLDRSMLGSRSDLAYNADGSLTVAVQAERPADVPESNWLPAPKSGPFEIAIRLCPRPEIPRPHLAATGRHPRRLNKKRGTP